MFPMFAMTSGENATTLAFNDAGTARLSRMRRREKRKLRLRKSGGLDGTVAWL